MVLPYPFAAALHCCQLNRVRGRRHPATLARGCDSERQAKECPRPFPLVIARQGRQRPTEAGLRRRSAHLVGGSPLGSRLLLQVQVRPATRRFTRRHTHNIASRARRIGVAARGNCCAIASNLPGCAPRPSSHRSPSQTRSQLHRLSDTPAHGGTSRGLRVIPTIGRGYSGDRQSFRVPRTEPDRLFHQQYRPSRAGSGDPDSDVSFGCVWSGDGGLGGAGCRWRREHCG